MDKIVWLLLLLPFTTIAQSKKKKLLLEQQANTALTTAIKNHVQYLADDKLEGRRTGTKGESLAMQYVIDQYTKAGIEPKGSDGYIQPFEINEGKQITTSNQLVINGKALILNTHYFPLAFSANTTIKGDLAFGLNEDSNPFSKDVKEWLEDNQNNPHFDMEEAIKTYADKSAKNGATALFLYNSSKLIDNIQFNKNDKSTLSKIPIVYITKEGEATFFKNHDETKQIALTVNITPQIRTGHNIIAYINNNANHTIILGAHYDHLGFGEDKNALDTGLVIHNGADDNASGTAALIELAKLLKNSTAKENNYLFIHFSGEELGLLGSKFWIEHPSINITPNYMINMDMIGRYDTTHKLTVGGYGTSSTWSSVFETTLNKNLLLKFDSTGSGPSDHASFYRANIPVLFFFTGSHQDYHKATDDWEKINYDGEREIVQYVHRLIESTNQKGKLPFTKTAEPTMGKSTRFTVSLGVIPDYGFSGNGVRIDGVSSGKIADKIGLQAGDILIQLGDYKFSDVNNYMQTLSKFKKGDATKLIIKRQEVEKVFDIVF